MQVKLPSGAELDITMASFDEANRLFKVVNREVEKVKISLGVLGKVGKLDDINVTDDLINTLKDLGTRLLGSDEVESALWPCMLRSTYNKERVTKDLFDREATRGEYLVIAKEVMVYNLTPFFGSLSSLFPQLLSKISSDPK